MAAWSSWGCADAASAAAASVATPAPAGRSQPRMLCLCQYSLAWRGSKPVPAAARNLPAVDLVRI